MKMLWMESYLFYCSVRLGVLIIAVLTFIQLCIPAIYLLIFGIEVLDPIVKLFENDDYYRKSVVVIRALHWIENHGQTTTILMCISLLIHMIFCILAIVGALKLQKWLLFPYIIAEFLRVIYCLTWHIVLMIMLKKKLNLGVLIAVTLAGGFLILYLGYNWATSVALFQIIGLIRSARYRQLYGDDPYRPQLPPNYGQALAPPAYGTVENVRVLLTPNTNDIDALKQKQHQPTAAGVLTQKIRKPVIAVLPANIAHQPRFSLAKRHTQQQQNVNKQNDYNATNSGNWQWSELLIGGRGRKHNAPLIGQKW